MGDDAVVIKLPARTANGKPRRVFERVCDSIRDDLASGVLKVGEKLPAEREIAEQHGVSRSVVREAIRALEATGLLGLKAGVNGGAFIMRPDGAAFTRSIQDVVLRGDLSLHDLTEVRMQLLVAAVGLAVSRRNPADVTALELNLKDTEALVDNIEAGGTASGAADIVARFSKLIGLASKNKLLSMLINSVTDIQMHAFVALDMPFDRRLLNYRRVVIEAIADQDGALATEQVIEYLGATHELILSFVRENAPQALEDWLPRESAEGEVGLPLFDAPPPPGYPAASGSGDDAMRALRDENTQLKILLADAMLELRASARS